jgi:uncharacterized protein YukE
MDVTSLVDLANKLDRLGKTLKQAQKMVEATEGIGFIMTPPV